MRLGQGNVGWRELLAALVPALSAGVMTAWMLSGFLYGKSTLPWLLLSLAIPAALAFAVNLLAPVATNRRKARWLALPVLVAVPTVSVTIAEFGIAAGAIPEVMLVRVFFYPVFLVLGLVAMGAVVLASQEGALRSGRKGSVRGRRAGRGR